MDMQKFEVSEMSETEMYGANLNVTTSSSQ